MTVPYTTFRAQVEAGNVADVTSKGDVDPGRLQDGGDLPAGQGREAPTPFDTSRPAFADDGLCNSSPEARGGQRQAGRRGPLPARDAAPQLRPDHAARAAVRLADAPGDGRRGRRRSAASAARRPSATRTGQRASRSRTWRASTRPRTSWSRWSTSWQPRQVRAARRGDPEGVLLVRAARHRQDPAGPRRGRRGRRALLLQLGLGVRRDDRRRRRQPGARPVRAGQGGRALDHLHRRARRDRPGALGRQLLGGNDEREQTLNQILTEMDGFTGSEGVIVHRRHQPRRDPRPGAAAAGPVRPPGGGQPAGPRGRAADPAGAHPQGAAGRRRRPRRHRLVDPGHGRRRPQEPGQRGRAAPPPGAATRRCTLADFTDALEKIVLGAERRIMLSPEERERTAYHESGHALLGHARSPAPTRCARSRSSPAGARSA